MRYLLLSLPLSLAACLEAPPPMASDYNGHMVKNVDHDFPLGSSYRQSPIYAKAAEICGGEAIYQGMRGIGNMQGEHAFICVR